MKSGPPRELFQKVITIADTKSSLPLRSRDSLNGWGVDCRVNRLRGGDFFYQAGGRFTSKLGFVLKSDGSIILRKYNPGDWELVIDPTYNYARYVIETRIDEQEKAAIRNSTGDTVEEKIRYLEQKVSDNAALLHSLFSLYISAGRFKDAEGILVKEVEKWPDFFLTHMYLGNFYLHAVAHERGMGLPPQLSTGEWVNLSLKDLGYASDHTLGLATQHIQEALKLAPKKSKDMQKRLKAAVAELAKF